MWLRQNPAATGAEQQEEYVVDNIRNIHSKWVQCHKFQKASMSEVQVQCCLDNSDDEIQFEYVTMSAGKFDKGINPKQTKMMDDLVNTAIYTD